MGKKADDVCQLAFLNVDTFPALTSDPKNGTARATFKKGRLMYGDDNKFIYFNCACTKLIQTSLV
jgi:hypothetical protein